MKIIGLIGGMSWKSSLEYYRIINERIKQKLGGLHSAKCVMYSVDFAEIEKLQHAGKWEEATEMMVDAAQRVERAGAEMVVICTNTMHRMASDVEKSVQIPLFHIADATAKRIESKGLNKVGLLGTRFTMEQEFYKGKLENVPNLQVLIPSEKEREYVHEVIFKELCVGMVKEKSKKRFQQIIENLVSQGAQGIILGCTEIPLLVKKEDSSVPLFDTTWIHASQAVDFALNLTDF
ncbi:aspartate/glutamate racemase family protein [bacterium]|nr:aspartate/glutamate racemase family protein [bacterium]